MKMEIKDTLVVAKEFTDTPGARDREDGDFSGQEFLEDYLSGRFEKAVVGNYKLLIDLDGLWGCPSSFVSGSFGALSMERGADLLLKHLEFKSLKNPTRVGKFIAEIKDPAKKL